MQSLPTYVLLAGLPGTGKTTIARALSRRLSDIGFWSVVLNKDEVRAALFPGWATDYSDAQDELCMQALLEAAHYLRCKTEPPHFIFFDGRTFSRSAQIESIITAAVAGGSAWRILHLVCPPAIAQQRLANQDLTHPAANRTFALYGKLQTQFELIQRPHLVLDTARPIEDTVEKARSFLCAAESKSGGDL